jgi:hypothetical protein
MKNSKFDKIYIENINNIITEKYHHKYVGGWNQKTAGAAIGNMLKSAVFKELESLNDLFVPKSWFDFKNVFKSKEKSDESLNIINYNVAGCMIQVTMETDDQKAIKNLIYGKEKGEDIGQKKPGGLIFNKEFAEIFKEIGLSKTDESEKTVRFKVRFSFYKPKFVENAKQSKRINPNYLKSIVGNIYFIFDEEEINVGTCEYFQSRYANMDPPKPLKDQIKDMWDKPNKDFGLIGSLVSKGVGAAVAGVAGGLFSKTVQEENFEITIDEKFNFSKNITDIKGEKRAKENLQNIKNELVENFFDNISDELTDSILNFNVENSDDENGYVLSIILDEIKLMDVTMEINDDGE